MNARATEAMQRMGGEVVQAVRSYVSRALAPLEKRLAKIEQRTAADIFADAYRGTWRAGESYERGQLCTDHGGLWVCATDTNSRPGSGPHWVLAVKAGRDGRS